MCEKEKFFLELIDGFKWKYDNNQYPNYLFGFKDDVCLFEICDDSSLNIKKIITNYRLGVEHEIYDLWFYLSDENIWTVFESNFNMNYDEICEFVSYIVKKHFKLKNVKIAQTYEFFTIKAENHFKKQYKKN